MNILLIRPKSPPGIHGLSEGLRWWRADALTPPHQEAVLAALTPEDISSTIADVQAGDPVPFDQDARLAVFVADFDQVPGLRYLYGRLRAAGTPVAAGGPMPSALPQEVAFADTVLVGDLEALWPRLIDAVRAGPPYPDRIRADQPLRLADLPPPDWSGVNLRRYRLGVVSVARRVHPGDAPAKTSTAALSFRTPDQVTEELKTLLDHGVRRARLLTPDILAEEEVASEILETLAKFHRDHPPGLRLEARCDARHVTARAAARLSHAGVTRVDLTLPCGEGDGADTLNQALEAVRTLRGEGLIVRTDATLDADDPMGACDLLAGSLDDLRAPVALRAARVYPGTDRWKQAENADRLIRGSKDLPYKRQVFDTPNVRPRKGSLETLQQRIRELLLDLASADQILKRLRALAQEARNVPATARMPFLEDLEATVRMLLGALDNPGEQRVRLTARALLALVAARPATGIWTQALDALLDEVANRSLVLKTAEGRKLEVETPPRSLKERAIGAMGRLMGALAAARTSAPTSTR